MTRSEPSWEDGVRAAVSDLPRVLGDTGAGGSGPVLVSVGGLHGNETSGVLALQRVFARLAENRTGLVGRLVGWTGNRAALAAGCRYLDQDLNRVWLRDVLDGMDADGTTGVREVEEVREILREYDELASLPRGRLALLDLHSTSGGGSAFTNLDDTLINRELAFAIPVPHVLGLEEEVAGTLVGYFNEQGRAAIGFEAGQHLDPESVDRAEAAVWLCMEAAGVLARGERAEVAEARALLVDQHRASPHVVEVRHRHPVGSDDGFDMSPGFRNFQEIDEGQLLARDRSGPLTAPMNGLILMPLYQGQGDDGYFIVRRVHAAWLGVSAVLRKLRFDSLLHWLPGVQRAEGRRRKTFVVDLHRARVLALQIFHLLGYKRVGRTETQLIMRKRDLWAH